MTCRRVILAPNEIVIDRRDLDYCIDALKAGINAAKTYSTHPDNPATKMAAAYSYHIGRTLSELRKIRDAARA